MVADNHIAPKGPSTPGWIRVTAVPDSSQPCTRCGERISFARKLYPSKHRYLALDANAEIVDSHLSVDAIHHCRSEK